MGTKQILAKLKKVKIKKHLYSETKVQKIIEKDFSRYKHKNFAPKGIQVLGAPRGFKPDFIIGNIAFELKVLKGSNATLAITQGIGQCLIYRLKHRITCLALFDALDTLDDEYDFRDRRFKNFLKKNNIYLVAIRPRKK